MLNDVDKLIKTYNIENENGDAINFKLGITRAIAVQGFKKYPEYFDEMMKNQRAIEKAEKSSDKLNGGEVLNLLNLSIDTQKYSYLIVQEILPDMLEYANSELGECKDYKECAQKIIAFCKENEIEFDYVDENDELVQGFYSNVMELVSLGFTSGSIHKKGKAKMTIK